VSDISRRLFWDKYKTHKYSVGRAYSCWMLNCWWCITWPAGFKRLILRIRPSAPLPRKLRYVCQNIVRILISFTGAFRAILRPIRYVPGTRAVLNGPGVKMSSQLRMVPKLKCVELYLHFLVCSYDVVLIKDGFTFTPACYILFQSLVVMAAAHTECNT